MSTLRSVPQALAGAMDAGDGETLIEDHARAAEHSLTSEDLAKIDTILPPGFTYGIDIRKRNRWALSSIAEFGRIRFWGRIESRKESVSGNGQP